mgnify:FL=1
MNHNFESPKKRKLTKEDWKNLFSGLKDLLPFIIVGAFLMIGAAIIEVISPTYLGDLTREISSHAVTKTIDLNLVQNLAIILVILYVTVALAQTIGNFLFTTATQRYCNSLRKAIETKINRLPLRYFDSHQTGDTMSRVTNDVDSISQNLDTTLSTLSESLFLLILTIIMMFITCYQMALVVFATLPLMALFVAGDMKLAMPQFKKRQRKIGEVNAIVEENYSGQKVIKLFGAEERHNSSFNEANVDLGKTLFKAQICGGLMMPTMNFISNFAYVAVLVAGGLLMCSENSGVDFGTIASFLVYVRLFQQPLTSIAQAMNNIQTIGAANARVYEFLSEEELSDESNKPRLLLDPSNGKEAVKGKVNFSHVSFSYDSSREIIHDFSIDINPGMKVAIVGPTGAGKTTMVNLLMRFYEINSGSIYVDDKNIALMSREEIHDLFGMVLQDTWVFQGTVRENLIYNTSNVSDARLQEVLKEANLKYFVDTLPGGLDYEIVDPSSISSGQRQLITIARAMIRNAPLLILDEATSNVDTRTEEIIQEAMDRLSKGRTSFVIAHRLSTIKNSDLILVMKDGNIVEQGTHDSLMKENGFYASLYNSQFAFE